MPAVPIYARVPESTKAEVETYSAETGQTFSSSVAELLTIALTRIERERDDEQWERELAELRLKNAELQGQLNNSRAALGSLGPQLQQRMATCKQKGCGHTLTAHDLLFERRCPKCGEGVGELVSGDQARVSTADLLVVLGTVGAVLGLAYMLAGDS